MIVFSSFFFFSPNESIRQSVIDREKESNSDAYKQKRRWSEQPGLLLQWESDVYFYDRPSIVLYFALFKFEKNSVESTCFKF